MGGYFKALPDGAPYAFQNWFYWFDTSLFLFKIKIIICLLSNPGNKKTLVKGLFLIFINLKF